MVDFNQSMSMSKNSSSIDISSLHISPAACIGSAALILATVLGNGLVLAALLLDKRLHSPSFLLIANMAVADLLLGLLLQFNQENEKQICFMFQVFQFYRSLLFWKFWTIVGYLDKDSVALG